MEAAAATPTLPSPPACTWAARRPRGSCVTSYRSAVDCSVMTAGSPTSARRPPSAPTCATRRARRVLWHTNGWRDRGCRRGPSNARRPRTEASSGFASASLTPTTAPQLGDDVSSFFAPGPRRHRLAARGRRRATRRSCASCRRRAAAGASAQQTVLMSSASSGRRRRRIARRRRRRERLLSASLHHHPGSPGQVGRAAATRRRAPGPLTKRRPWPPPPRAADDADAPIAGAGAGAHADDAEISPNRRARPAAHRRA